MSRDLTYIDISHLEYMEALEKLKNAIPDFSDISLSIEFGADHAQSKIIRDFVGSIFAYHKISSPWGGRFILITDELVNNAIEHGSTAWDLDKCVIEAGRGSDGIFHISLEVHDTGTGKDAMKPEAMEEIKKDRTQNDGTYMEKRGRGLFHITEKLVDRLEFSESEKGGLAVRIEKNIEKA
jgi:anti-sigma regulatory factor (Ser/Thr protein kinase)